MTQYVQAQTPTGEPVPVTPEAGTAATPVTITITAIESTSVAVPVIELFVDPQSDEMVFTAMTSDPDVARGRFTTNAITYDEDGVGTITPGIVEAWWDALDDQDKIAGGDDNLDCNAKASRLGFEIGVDGPDEDTNPDNAPATLADPNAQAGLCEDYSELEDPDGGTTASPAGTATNEAQLMVVQAFHWDMLNGAEMEAVAEAADESDPKDYAKPFSRLGTTERAGVASFFADGLLAAGSGSLTLFNEGIAADGTGGKAGEATITVKASDVVGRLISVGRDDTVDAKILTAKANLTETGTIGDFEFTVDADTDGPTWGTGHFPSYCRGRK